ncbi:hypothetical protein FRX31_012415 [Thalictrum thalictroides]|uniref:Uncharacterized protein n=1 Tax=Thalictrum thalictroides TaxID=46969 RepID=A0A7J6WLZ7_THATH|nr:hypothetical protein FRX31_012415 [Thalictrum thalictroides]
MEDEIKHQKELEDDNRKLAEKLAQQIQFKNDSKQKAVILHECNEASKVNLFSDDLKQTEDELKHQKEWDEDNRKLAENVEQQFQFQSETQPYEETNGGSRGADIPLTPDITDEITKIYKSLHPRPGTQIIEATQSHINNDAICNQQKPQDIPQELFNMLKMAQKTLVIQKGRGKLQKSI